MREGGGEGRGTRVGRKKKQRGRGVPATVSLSSDAPLISSSPCSVLILGDQFGPVSVVGGAYSPLPNVTAAYGLPSDSVLRYTAASCAVTTAQTVITCLTAPGIGLGYIWQVAVGGQLAPRKPTSPQNSPYIPAKLSDGTREVGCSRQKK